jgi:hypothetical protein
MDRDVRKWVSYYTDELHQGKFPPSNAWRDVRYITIDSANCTVKCELCQTGLMQYLGRKSGGAIVQHVNGSKHQGNYSIISKHVEKKLRDVANLERYSALEEEFDATDGVYRQLGGLLDNQKATVCSILYQFIASSFNFQRLQVGAAGVVADAESIALLRKAQALVKKYSRLETAVILDLALLKASTRSEFDTIDELRDAFYLSRSADESVYSDLKRASSILSWAKDRRSVNGSSAVVKFIMARICYY